METMCLPVKSGWQKWGEVMTANNERTRLIRLVQVGRRSLGLDEET